MPDAATVLLTRPAGLNRELTDKLEEHGFEVIEAPLLEIVPVAPDPEARRIATDLDLYDDVIFISGNAVAYGMGLLERYWPRWPASLRWAAVGPATAGRLREYDLSVIHPERDASDGLLAMDDFSDVAGRRILIVRGVGGRELLANSLRERGARVDYLEVYRRRPRPWSDDFVRDLERRRPDCAVITSREALEQFSRVVKGKALEPILIVPSERVRSVAIELGFAKVEAVGDMRDDSLVAAIIEHLS